MRVHSKDGTAYFEISIINESYKIDLYKIKYDSEEEKYYTVNVTSEKSGVYSSLESAIAEAERRLALLSAP